MQSTVIFTTRVSELEEGEVSCLCDASRIDAGDSHDARRPDAVRADLHLI